MSMLKVGDKLPEFKLTATVDTDISKAFTEITHASYPGKWLVLFLRTGESQHEWSILFP